MLRAFELHRPATVAEASALLTARPDAALYAGGTELLLLMKAGLVRPADVIDLKRIPDLDGLVERDGGLEVGATVTHRRLERSPAVRARWPLVAGVAAHVANVRVRNVGTVGGNLAFADPHSDLATLFLVFDATVRLVAADGVREVSLPDFVRILAFVIVFMSMYATALEALGSSGHQLHRALVLNSAAIVGGGTVALATWLFGVNGTFAAGYAVEAGTAAFAWFILLRLAAAHETPPAGLEHAGAMG